MTYIFSLSQEHTELPRKEVEHTFRAEDIDYEITDTKGSLLFVEADTVDGMDRLAMSFEIGELLYEFAPDNYQKLAATDGIGTEQSFAVRKEVIDDTDAPDELEQNIGRIIDKHSDGHVDLDDPDITYRVYLVDDTAYLCRIETFIDRSQYEQRQNQYRPYTSPVSIHPRLARTLVNLAEAPRDGTLLDPFCGTGGVLLEAAMIGCDGYGLDIQEEMVDGARKNLDAFDASGDIRQGSFDNVEDVFEDTLPFDAVVTDLPYGKASKVEDNPTQAFVETAQDLTRGTVAFMSDRDRIGDLEPAHEIFVHRSLTRYIYILD